MKLGIPAKNANKKDEIEEEEKEDHAKPDNKSVVFNEIDNGEDSEGNKEEKSTGDNRCNNHGGSGDIHVRRACRAHQHAAKSNGDYRSEYRAHGEARFQVLIFIFHQHCIFAGSFDVFLKFALCSCGFVVVLQILGGKRALVGGMLLCRLDGVTNLRSAAAAEVGIFSQFVSAIGAKHSWFLSLGAFARSKQIG